MQPFIRHVNSLQNLWKSVCISFLELRKIRPFSVPTAITLSSCTVTHATSAFSLDMAEHCTHTFQVISHQTTVMHKKPVLRPYHRVQSWHEAGENLLSGWHMWNFELWPRVGPHAITAQLPNLCHSSAEQKRDESVWCEMSGVKHYSEYKLNY